MLMLILEEYKCVMNIPYFNTSHVNVNPLSSNSARHFASYFNTSHVNVNHTHANWIYVDDIYFNTSHVNVNQI